MKSILLMGVLFLTGLVSCSEKEPTHEEKLKEVVEVYVANMLKSEPILEYSIDSIEINNITEKSKLLVESLADKNEALKKMGEAKELGKQYQSTKILVDVIKEGEGESSTAKIGLNSMNEYKEEADILIKEAKQLIKDAEYKMEKWETADSTDVSYYEVIARGDITSIKNVQKNSLFPFHISKDYKILKEPLELLRVRK